MSRDSLHPAKAHERRIGNIPAELVIQPGEMHVSDVKLTCFAFSHGKYEGLTGWHGLSVSLFFSDGE